MIILFGGSFNPPTNAHFQIIEKLNNLLNPTKIIVMPVGNRYPKKNLASDQNRLEMLQLVSNHFSNVEVSDFEINQPFVGTIRALEHFSNVYNKNICLAIGADNFKTIDQWIEANKLIKNYPIIIFNRQNLIDNQMVTDFEAKYQVKLTIVKFDNNISASKIRSDVDKYRQFLLPEVYAYIKNNQLYKEE